MAEPQAGLTSRVASGTGRSKSHKHGESGRMTIPRPDNNLFMQLGTMRASSPWTTIAASFCYSSPHTLVVEGGLRDMSAPQYQKLPYSGVVSFMQQ